MSSNGPDLFTQGKDLGKFLSIIKLYKVRMDLKILAYSLGKNVVHIILMDMNEESSKYIKRIKDTYDYYYKDEYGFERIFMDKFKLKEICKFETMENAIRYIHSIGYNSKKRYDNYDYLLKDDIIDAPYLLTAFGKDKDEGKRNFIESMVKEIDEEYKLQFREMEYFPEDKKKMRLERARNFLWSYLDENELRIEELSFDINTYHTQNLIDQYRRKTDLSYRDIGEVLSLSHTTVIRLHNKVRTSH
jgi:hypothetical protein